MQMKRLLVLVVLLVLFVNSAFAEPWRVFDNADLSTEEEEEAIEKAITDFQRSTNMDFVVLSTDDYLGETETVAQFFYRNGPFGFGSLASGYIYYFDKFHNLHTAYAFGDATQKKEELIKVFEEANKTEMNSWCDFVLHLIRDIKALALDE